MKATLVIADYADLANGKLGVLGGGITWFYAHSSVPLSVAAFIYADAADADKSHTLRLRIVNLAGEPVGFTGDDGKPYRYEIEDTVTWPARPAVDDDLDYLWVGRWFGISIDPGMHRFELIIDDQVVGAQAVQVRPREG
jgi:hypothetical protein